jgi:hypothetical protein
MNGFEEFWNVLKSELRGRQSIENWTQDKGHLGRGDFYAESRGDYINCFLEYGEVQKEETESDKNLRNMIWNRRKDFKKTKLKPEQFLIVVP